MAEAAGQPFYYHRSVAPLMWVFVGLASVELVVVHGLVALWSVPVAIGLSVLTLASIGWLVWVIATFRRLPVLITADLLIMRVGRLKSLTVPLAQVAGVRDQWDAAALKRPDVLRLSLIAYPNVLVDLTEPSAGRRRVAALAHRLNDPAAFRTALSRALAAPSP